MKLRAKRDNPIVEPRIADFFYTFIISMTSKDKAMLPDHLYRMVNTEKKAKRFAEISTTDQKRELLSYFRVGFFWTFVALNKCTNRNYLEIMKEFKKGNSVGALSEMCSKGICVTSDEEHYYLLQQMTRVGTSSEYVRNMEMVRSATAIKRWNIKFNPKGGLEELDELAITISRLLGAVLANVDSIESFCGVQGHEYQILNYFYQRRHKYIDVDTLVLHFTGEMSQAKVKLALGKLAKEYCLQPGVDPNEKEYCITKVGINTIHKFRDRVLKTLNF